jgi:uncharacterized protein (TIGR03067 family)
MNSRPAFFALLAALPVAADDKKPDPADDLKALQGVWEIVSTTYDGQKVSSRGRTLVFRDKKFTAFVGEMQGRTLTFTLDPAASPRHIDLDRGGKDGKALGVYAIDKDELKLCYAEPGAERPTGFESKAGKKVFLVVLRRSKG